VVNFAALTLILVVQGPGTIAALPPADSLPLTSAVQRAEGHVLRPGTRKMDAVSGVPVTLHRVGPDKQGPLDSTITDREGRYSFRYRRTGSPDAVYFVSASYDGIAYFSNPLEIPVVTGDAGEIVVFDTTTRHVPISVRGHHIVISSVDANGLRAVDEVYELANDSSVTKVASGASPDRAVWTAPMLAGATQPKPGEGDFPASAIAFGGGNVFLLAPFAPGLKQLAIHYSLPAGSFPLTARVLVPTAVLEVLLEETSGTVSGARLKEVAPVTLEKRNFRRFVANDVPASSSAAIDLPKPASRPSALDSRYLIALILAFGGVMVAVLAHALRRK
jgi:hypothetical protein